MRALLLFLLSAWATLASCVPPPNNYDYEVQDWRARCITNNSSVDGASYVATTTFMQQLKWWNLRRFINRANIYLGADTNALMCPLIRNFVFTDAISSQSDTLVAFVATNYSATGAKCNGTTQYINTGLAANGFSSASDIHLATYSRTSIYEVGGAIGSADSVGYVNYFLFGWIDSNCYMYFGGTGDQTSAADPTPPTGFYLGTRTSTTSRVIYKNGVSINSSGATVGGSINGNVIFVHGLNSNNALNSPTHRELCFYGVGIGVPATYQGNYYKAVQRLQLTRNRAIIP